MRKRLRKVAKMVATAMTLLVTTMITTITAITPATTTRVAALEADSLRSPWRVEAMPGYTSYWDCVYFGSYPQREVVADEAGMASVDERQRNGKDFVVDAALYKALTQAAGWDEHGDIELDGVRYRRMSAADAIDIYDIDKNPSMASQYYNWGDVTYHYFRYDPIKWRVLEVSDGELYLMADRNLEIKPLNTFQDDEWETCWMRTYLNTEFFDTAFKAQEQAAIVPTPFSVSTVISGGQTRLEYSDTDMVGLLKTQDAQDARYGFSSGAVTYAPELILTTTTYVKALGARTQQPEKGCPWWLNQVNSSLSFCNELEHIYVTALGGTMNLVGDARAQMGVVPTVHIKQSATDTYLYAGTMNSKGMVDEPDYRASQKVTVTSTYTKTYGDKAFKVNAKTSGTGALQYSSSDASIATVSATGKVSIKKAGKVKIKVYAKENEDYKQSSTKTITITIKKASNTLSLKATTKSLKASSLKKKAASYTLVASAKGKAKVTYELLDITKKAKKYVTVSKSGKVSVKKGLAKGTYTLKLKLTSASVTNYSKTSKTFKVKLVVK